MAIGINMDDTAIPWDVHFALMNERIDKAKKFERERQVILLEAKEKAHAAIKEFLNGNEE